MASETWWSISSRIWPLMMYQRCWAMVRGYQPNFWWQNWRLWWTGGRERRELQHPRQGHAGGGVSDRQTVLWEWQLDPPVAQGRFVCHTLRVDLPFSAACNCRFTIQESQWRWQGSGACAKMVGSIRKSHVDMEHLQEFQCNVKDLATLVGQVNTVWLRVFSTQRRRVLLKIWIRHPCASAVFI